ncbi:hypothetical protein FDZ71_00400 [bacterium]|nr:MAG: hypothetical protein FDZ71_00400 [bacterium]
MICNHCKKEVQDTGKFYPIGDVFVRIKRPYALPDHYMAEGLCQDCQQNLARELVTLIGFYQKEKALT